MTGRVWVVESASDEISIRIELPDRGTRPQIELRTTAVSENVWRRSEHIGVRYTCETEYDPFENETDARALRAIGDQMLSWDVHVQGRFSNSVSEWRSSALVGAARGEQVDEAERGSEASALECFFGINEALYGARPTVHRIPDAPIDAFAVKLPPVETDADLEPYLNKVGEVGPLVRTHFAKLGFGWTECGRVRMVPTPASFVDFWSATGVRGRATKQHWFRRSSRRFL